MCASLIEFKLRTRGYLIQWRCIINKSMNSAADDARLLGVSSGNLKNPIGPTVENMLLCLGFITLGCLKAGNFGKKEVTIVRTYG